jgi:hypothetical protein
LEETVTDKIVHDLFCGRGGLSVGFAQAGFRTIGFDREDFSRWYPGEFVRADVRYLDGRAWRGRLRALVGSPPCTEFTPLTNLAYKRGFRGPRNPEKGLALVREFARLVDEAEPDYWFMENVRASVPYISTVLGSPSFIKNAWVGWGNLPGFLLPDSNRKFKFDRARVNNYVWPNGMRQSRPSSSGRGKNAVVPLWLSKAIAGACLTEGSP